MTEPRVELDDRGRVRAVRFRDGTEVPAELVVMAVGIRPNTALAASMRLHVARGIVVNDTMQTTTDARIYAVGECAAHRGVARHHPGAEDAPARGAALGDQVVQIDRLVRPVKVAEPDMQDARGEAGAGIAGARDLRCQSAEVRFAQRRGHDDLPMG